MENKHTQDDLRMLQALPLDVKLESNNKVYAANNTSYGLGLNYAINKKLKV